MESRPVLSASWPPLDTRALLIDHISAWNAAGYPCPAFQFVLRNGQPYEGVREGPRRMTPKLCFSNAFEVCEEHEREGHAVRYVEGYIARRSTNGFLFLHAWALIDGVPYDPTLRGNADASYFGVEFDFLKVRRQLVRTGYYGLLDGPITHANRTFMVECDPGMASYLKGPAHG